MRITILLLLTGIYIIFPVSCRKSEGIPMEDIYTAYELFYDANQNITYASATFINNRSAIKLNAIHKVSFNGKELKFVEAGSYYQTQFAGLINEGTFKWTNGKKTINNTIQLHAIDFAPMPDTLIAAETDSLLFTGDPIGQYELIKLVIDGSLENDTYEYFESNPGNTLIRLSGLDEVTLGNNTAFIERQYAPENIVHSGSGGRLVSRYRCKNKTLIFIKN